jgi:hypothetical protein
MAHLPYGILCSAGNRLENMVASVVCLVTMIEPGRRPLLGVNIRRALKDLYGSLPTMCGSHGYWAVSRSCQCGHRQITTPAPTHRQFGVCPLAAMVADLVPVIGAPASSVGIRVRPDPARQ